MQIEKFVEILSKNNIDFFTGVPDSKLKAFCDYLVDQYGVSDKHVIAVNEGNAVALAAGYHLATGKIPCVYMQNSGIGNAMNPIASLISKRVYAIPCVFVIGWRGEPGLKDEPQHVFQGEITEPILNSLQIDHVIIDEDLTDDDFEKKFNLLCEKHISGESIAIIVKKNALKNSNKITYKNEHNTKREDIIKCIVDFSKEDTIVSTTGKTSRELYEIREMNGQSHEHDFLTVGSMGHSSGIALGIALQKPTRRVWCIDGDGAALMHLGSMAMIGSKSPENFIHIIINNEAHESVGGQPTAANKINLKELALSCKYRKAYSLEGLEELKTILSSSMNETGPIMIEIKSAIGARSDLGRPSSTPVENKNMFMKDLK